MDDIAASKGQMTVQEHAIMVANHGQQSMFAGALAGTIMSAVRHTFIPDMATQHLEYAKTILVRGWEMGRKGKEGRYHGSYWGF